MHGDGGSIVANYVMTPEPIGTGLLRTERGKTEVDGHPYDVTIEYFARAVVGDGRPVVDGRDAVNALAVCPSILDSAHTGTLAPVDFQ